MYHSIAKLFMPIMLGAAAHVKSHQFSLYLIQPFHSYPCYLPPSIFHSQMSQSHEVDPSSSSTEENHVAGAAAPGGVVHLL
jgi:hypothetical protein